MEDNQQFLKLLEKIKNKTKKFVGEQDVIDDNELLKEYQIKKLTKVILNYLYQY